MLLLQYCWFNCLTSVGCGCGLVQKCACVSCGTEMLRCIESVMLLEEMKGMRMRKIDGHAIVD